MPYRLLGSFRSTFTKSFALPRAWDFRPLVLSNTVMAKAISRRRQFRPTELEDVENVEAYRPGGLHPVLIGDELGTGRYRVLHKLGYGGFSTI